MKLPDFKLRPDWDEDNASHIARHSISPEQAEEVYYSEGPYATIAVRRKSPRGKEFRYQLWGTDAEGNFIVVIIAVFPRYSIWRSVAAYKMSRGTRKAYLKRLKR